VLTGSAARSASEAATMAREASGAPHVSTTLAAPAGFARASTTARWRRGESQREAARRGAAGGEGSVPLTRPRISVVRARNGGQPGLSTAVVRGILRFGWEEWHGSGREREVGGICLVFVRVLQRARACGFWGRGAVG
jgi:hypothetical protein